MQDKRENCCGNKSGEDMQQLAVKFYGNGSTQGWYLGQGHEAAVGICVSLYLL